MSEKVFVVVDYQNDFVNGSLGVLEADLMCEKIVLVAKEFIQNKNVVIATLDTHEKDYLETLEGLNLPVKHCIKNTYGHELFGEFKELEKEITCIEKDCFGSITLGETLKKLDPKEIYFAGLVADICVISNIFIVKSYCKNAKIFVYKDLIKSINDEKYNAAIEIMNSISVVLV